ncbi:hypothetical protein BDY19DRAFT_637150 [Irpex rosettiformis]|uniref:Uncharacterized protein n=1 Tax=Irpex rosettiformis TaxID=378272 RepID=A0ACB8UBF4_9APHY|nr:hypothetical protein BDY19DRAFT_637150 [Irpex rosettiformis]
MAVAPKTRRTSRRIPVAKSNLRSGSWEAGDGTIWRSLRPPVSSVPVQLFEPSVRVAEKQIPPEEPRIWAATKGELLTILPELSKALDANGSGIFKEEMALEPPLIFLEGNAWPDDHWGPEGVLEISIVREFMVPPGRGQNTNAFSVDFNENGDNDREMMLFDHPSGLLTNGPDVVAGDNDHTVCHPTTLLKNRGTESTAPLLLPVSSRGSTPSASAPISSSLAQTPSASSTGPSTSISASGLTGAFAMPNHNLRNLPPPPRLIPLPDVEKKWQTSWSPPMPTDGWHPMPGFPVVYPSLHMQSVNDPIPAVVAERNVEPGPSAVPNVSQISRPSSAFTPPPAHQQNELRLRPATFDTTPMRQQVLDSTSEDDGDEQRSSPSLREIFFAQYSSRDVNARLSHMMIDHPTGLISDSHYPEQVRPESESRMLTKEGEPRRRQSLTKWDRKPVVPPELPPELQHMQECQMYGIPVSIVMAKDSVLLPFALEEHVGLVYLGFFKIQDSSHAIISSELSAANGSLTAKVRWRYKFKWIPGGDPVKRGEPQPNHPWWADIPSEDSNAGQEPTPYSLLPMHLSSDFAKYSGYHCASWSEMTPRLGWHCMGCGRLNVQLQLCVQHCAKCGLGNGMVATGAMYVRDPHRMAPDSRPVDTYPEGVICDITDLEEDGMRTFVYTMRKGVYIRHLFTCNRSLVQKYANQLFSDVQMQIPLIWKAPKTGYETAPYFSYLAGTGFPADASAIPWEQVPECVTSIRNKMQDVAMHEGGLNSFQLRQMTILGWHKPGNRKGTTFYATTATIALLCLGADIELNIIPRGGFDENVHWDMDMYPNSSLDTLSTLLSRTGEDEDTLDILDLEDLELQYPDLPDDDDTAANEGDVEDSDDEEDIPLAITTARRREEATAAKQNGVLASASKYNSVSTAPSDMVGESASTTKNSRKKLEPMFITLVHGDLLLLSGDDFDYSIHRTGMSILAIGVDSGSKATS